VIATLTIFKIAIIYPPKTIVIAIALPVVAEVVVVCNFSGVTLEEAIFTDVTLALAIESVTIVERGIILSLSEVVQYIVYLCI